MKLKIKDKVKHQNIGGHEFRKDFEVSIDEVDHKAMEGNPACLNFVVRRHDFDTSFNKKLYYGHVYNKQKDTWLGYVVCEDELVEVPDDYFTPEPKGLLKFISKFRKKDK